MLLAKQSFWGPSVGHTLKHTPSDYPQTYTEYIAPGHIKLTQWQVHAFPCSTARQLFPSAKCQTGTVGLGNSRQKSFHFNTVLKPSPEITWVSWVDSVFLCFNFLSILSVHYSLMASPCQHYLPYPLLNLNTV